MVFVNIKLIFFDSFCFYEIKKSTVEQELPYAED